MTGAYWMLAVLFAVPIILAFFVPKLVRIFFFVLYAIIAYSIVAAGVAQGLALGGVLMMSLVCSAPLAVLGVAIWRGWRAPPRVSN